VPTRKELLENLQFEIENLSNRMTEGSEALQKQGDNQVQAAEIISNGLSNLGGDLIAAAVVGGFLSLAGKATGLIIGQLVEIRRKTDMIKSIQKLQERHAPLSYDFIVERSYVQGASKDVRQNLLNQLLHDEIVTAKESENGEVLCIEPNNPKLIAYWDWLDGLRDVVEKQGNKLSG
jgi:hypothetical protein